MNSKNTCWLLIDGDEFISSAKKACLKINEPILEDVTLTYKGLEIIVPAGTVFEGFAHPKDIEDKIEELLNDSISYLKEKFNYDNVIYTFYFSDRDTFRTDICNEYKNRNDVKVVFNLNNITRNIVMDKYQIYNKDTNKNGKVFSKSKFEADDLMGMYATFLQTKYDNPNIFIQSQDKDMKVIPEINIYNPKKELEEEKVEFISNKDSVLYFLSQVLSGDIADNVIHTPKRLDNFNNPMKNGYGESKVGAIKELKNRAYNLNHSFEMLFNFVKDLYIANNIEDRFLINCKLLRILTIEFYSIETETNYNFDEQYLFDYLNFKFNS
jgi:hypothetical protein